MITKQTVVDQITATENGVVLYRTATRVIEDGHVISETYHRTSLMPGQNVDDHPGNVRAVCTAIWTPEIIAAYEAELAK